ncbi:LytTR family DNA-binding domain-containing protein [Flammeovirga agarivorans]|uniref:LytTR family transcriptional regulator n=1 Tax=Flammeovirga agarivorans TaxID=2726742 RepID=A0A7X8SQM6_9BACT|nr:LytTR family DNA-binding domain-containing protein [Flammeovirga agarivorans]NLR94509.1 LytTR family transcriptional regulator [Flammeovirga agarivorans]
MTNLLNKLNAAFPLIEDNKIKSIASFLFGLFVFIFLYIFQPFGIADVVFYKPLLIGGYALITICNVAFCFFILPKIFTKIFNPEKWTVLKAILFSSVIILLISISNWLYTSTIGQEVLFISHSFIKFIGITISVGIFPTIVFILFLEWKLRSDKEQKAEHINTQIQEQELEETQEAISFQLEKKSFSIPLHQFLCIKSEGNYLEVYSEKNGAIQKEVIRLSLKKAKEQIQKDHNVHQCHRSYIANFDKIQKVSGNARNYELQLENLDFSIPVSRSFSKEMISIYK